MSDLYYWNHNIARQTEIRIYLWMHTKDVFDVVIYDFIFL